MPFCRAEKGLCTQRLSIVLALDVQEMILWKTHVYRILFFLIKQHFRGEGRGGAGGGLGFSVNPPVLP